MTPGGSAFLLFIYRGWIRWMWIDACVCVWLLFLASGCVSLLPSSQSTTKSRWPDYPGVQAAFDRIQTNLTSSAELKELGFDPATSPNVKILTYVDIIQRFMPNQGIRMEDLHPAVRQC